jgi:hypothetical protein
MEKNHDCFAKPSETVMKIATWLAAILLGCMTTVLHAANPVPAVFIQTGEKFATQEQAGSSVQALAGYISQQMTVSTNLFQARIFNDPAKAIGYITSQKAAVGIVTPGFYLTYVKALGMEPILETKRIGVAEERYVLVARKDAVTQLADLAGKTIGTQLAAEQRFVGGVLLQDKLGQEIRLQTLDDVEAAVFGLLEKAKDSPNAILMEESTWVSLFQPDQEVSAALQVVHRSEPVPGNLVVTFTANVGNLDLAKFKAAVAGMNTTDDGKAILRNIRVESFNEINHERLDRSRTLFTSQ